MVRMAFLRQIFRSNTSPACPEQVPKPKPIPMTTRLLTNPSSPARVPCSRRRSLDSTWSHPWDTHLRRSLRPLTPKSNNADDGQNERKIKSSVPTSTSETISLQMAAMESKLLRRIGRKGQARGFFSSPCGLAVTSQGDMVVVDTDNCRIQVFTAGGQFKTVFGEKGEAFHQLNRPMCVALWGLSEDFVVTDSLNKAVKIFNATGNHVRVLIHSEPLECPSGVAVTYDQQHIIVSDVCKHCIFVLDPDNGRIKTSFGSYGDKMTSFDSPNFVAVNSNNEIIVSDSGNMSIKVFTLTGEILQYFTVNDFHLPDDQFILLQGLAVDSENNILVAGNNSCFILAQNGRLWEVLRPEDGLESPRCIAQSPVTGNLVLTQCDMSLQHEISLHNYNAEDYRSLQVLPYVGIGTSTRGRRKRLQSRSTLQSLSEDSESEASHEHAQMKPNDPPLLNEPKTEPSTEQRPTIDQSPNSPGRAKRPSHISLPGKKSAAETESPTEVKEDKLQENRASIVDCNKDLVTSEKQEKVDSLEKSPGNKSQEENLPTDEQNSYGESPVTMGDKILDDIEQKYNVIMRRKKSDLEFATLKDNAKQCIEKIDAFCKTCDDNKRRSLTATDMVD